ncbi:MAG: AIR synthase-related protein, partial [Acidimicrobiia bacterium]|nr:AIR synthase-related protein [Acidimicrobiia bacterium]
GLYSAITDCGAGGLSSAVGEMADELGARVDLAAVPRKYPGLAPWEVWLSEAQERMVLACPNPGPLLALARRWQVEACVIGQFTGDGVLTVVDGSEAVVELDTGFLHDGRPQLRLQAGPIDYRRPHRREPRRLPGDMSADQCLLALLAHPSIRSNESVIRSYDHEVLGGTVIRPYGGPWLDGPADGTAIIPPGTVARPGADAVPEADAGDPPVAAAVGIGAALLVGRLDPEAMAWAAVDEAVRNVVVAGADPDRLSLLDNFAWGNPHRPEALAGLVAACRGCHDAAIAFGAPFVSGKDSLFNEFVYDNGDTDPVTPTLIITAVGVVPDVESIPSTGLVSAGNDVWLVGAPRGALGGSYLDEVAGVDGGGPVPPPDPSAVANHRAMHRAIRAGIIQSAHDVSDGGLAVAAAEWAFAGRLGMTLSVDTSHGPAELFGESAGRYLIEVRPSDGDLLTECIPGATRIGWITKDDRLRIGVEIDVSLEDIGRAFIGAGFTLEAEAFSIPAPSPVVDEGGDDGGEAPSDDAEIEDPSTEVAQSGPDTADEDWPEGEEE